MLRLFSALFFVSLLGCTIGPAADSLEPAQSGRGITVQVSVRSDISPSLWRHHAEVLAVQDDGLLLRSHHDHEQSIVRIAYSAIREARFDELSRLNFGDGAPPARREELRLLSRYPQGVDDDLLRRLLNAYDQDTLRTIP